MRRSLAPSQKLHNVAPKRPKLSSNDCREEIENSSQFDNITSKNTLLDALKAIRKNIDAGEGTTISGVDISYSLNEESDFSVESREYSTRTSERTSTTNVGRIENTLSPPTTKLSKFCPPTRFVPPLLACTSPKENTDSSTETKTDIAHYYSVIWYSAICCHVYMYMMFIILF